MTPEQEKEVITIGRKLQEIFPKMYGSIKFNLSPERKNVNINIAENKCFMILKNRR